MKLNYRSVRWEVCFFIRTKTQVEIWRKYSKIVVWNKVNKQIKERIPDFNEIRNFMWNGINKEL